MNLYTVCVFHIFLNCFFTWVHICVLSGPSPFESAHPEPLPGNSSSSLSVNAFSDKEQSTPRLRLCFDHQKIIAYIDMNLPPFNFLVMINSSSFYGHHGRSFSPHMEDIRTFESFSLAWQHFHPVLNVVDPSVFVKFFSPDVNCPWTCVSPLYHLNRQYLNYYLNITYMHITIICLMPLLDYTYLVRVESPSAFHYCY